MRDAHEPTPTPDRREVLRLLGFATAGGVAATVLAACGDKEQDECEPCNCDTGTGGTDDTSHGTGDDTGDTGAPMAQDPPWDYVELDPDAVAKRAYEAYYQGGCHYAVFEAIIGELQDKVGAPFTQIPTKMAIYGKGGMFGWGTLCGTLNGTGMVAQLLSSNAANIVSSIVDWYSNNELPDYEPEEPVVDFDCPTSVSDTPLCHVSVTRWCLASGYGGHTDERKERCGRMAAAVARKLAEVLNEELAGNPATYENPDEVNTCLGCHGDGGIRDVVLTEKAPTCELCHFNLASEHPDVTR